MQQSIGIKNKKYKFKVSSDQSIKTNTKTDQLFKRKKRSPIRTNLAKKLKNFQKNLR